MGASDIVWGHIRHFFNYLSLAQRFRLTSLTILVVGVIGIGWWMERQIEKQLVHRTTATTATFVDSLISPQLQELSYTPSISAQHIEVLNKLLRDTPLGQQVVSVRVWDKTGQMLYSTDDLALMDQVPPIEERLRQSWEGEITSEISFTRDQGNALGRNIGAQFLDIYSPVRLRGTNQIIAVAEFYQPVNDLPVDIATAQKECWLVVGLAMLVIYLLLAGFVKRIGDTIERRQTELNKQVASLTDRLHKNDELHERVRRAAARVATVNERYLKRIGAELENGPVQNLSLALLRLDTVFSLIEKGCPDTVQKDQGTAQLNIIQASLQQAAQEIRHISTWLGLPQLNQLTLTETAVRAVRTHERRTSTQVILNLDYPPEQASLPLKITLYRLIQEALNNAFRHAGGLGQRVCITEEARQLRVEVSDKGPGFDPKQSLVCGEHLGMMGMRERVESLGGLFQVESNAGDGTKIIACLSLQAERDDHTP